MTAWTGYFWDASQVPPAPSFLSLDLQSLAKPLWPVSVGADSQPALSSGSLTVNLIHAERKVSQTGAKAQSFIDDWYNHIHVTPSVAALGNLLSNETVPVEIWNAYFTNETMTAQSGGGTGVTLSTLSLPATFYPLQSVILSLGVSTIGPAVVDVVYTFTFSSESPTLSVTGTRAVIFSMMPDWSQPIQESLEWKTDIMVSRGGYEQRVQLRQVPRVIYEFLVTAHDNDYAFLDSLIAGWQSRVYSLPIWTDQIYLTAPLAAGGTVITVGDTTGLDMAVGSSIMIATDSINYEGAQILTIVETLGVTTITLVEPVIGSYTSSAFIVPCRNAYMDLENANADRPTAAVSQIKARFMILNNPTIAAVESSTLYESIGVWLQEPDRSENIAVKYQRKAKLIDYQIGTFIVDDIPQRPFAQRAYSYLYGDRADILIFKQWLAYRTGSLVPFLMPTWEENFTVAETINATDTQITVEYGGYTVFMNQLTGREKVGFLHNNGTWYFFDILGFSIGTLAGTELMTISSSFGFICQPTDFQMICYLELVRLDSDRIEISWETNTIANTKFATMSVTQ